MDHFQHFIFYEDGATKSVFCDAISNVGTLSVRGTAYAKIENDKLYVRAVLSSNYPNCSCDTGWKLDDTASCDSVGAGGSCADGQTVTAKVDIRSHIYVNVTNQPNCSAEKKW